MIPISLVGILAFPIANLKLAKRFRSLRDFTRLREDSEDAWHIRSGHLSTNTLRVLVKNVRNVAINGKKRIEC